MSNCTINFEEKNFLSSYNQISKILNQCNYSQYIMTNILDYDYNIEIINQGENTCICYASIYQLDNITGISLINNIPYFFKFSDNFTNISFSYPYTKRGNDISISSNLFSNSKNYKYSIYLNDEKYDSKSIIKNSEEIIIKYLNINDKCKFENICKVLLTIESKELSSNSMFVVIKSIEWEIPILIQFILILCSICLFVMLFIALFIVLYHTYKSRCKKEHLLEKNNKIFEKELIEK